jgi:protein TonB
MFDLITGKTKHMPRASGGPVVVSTVLHITLLTSVIALPLIFMSDVMPEVPTMMAFVAAAPAPPPPPPPPPPPAAARAKEPVPAKVSTSPDAAPINVPSRIEPEPAKPSGGDDLGVTGGVEGGVEGGVPGGVVAGIVGGIPTHAPAPPPPPPPPQGPVRVGGPIKEPALVRRVEPVYPELAIRAGVQGVVILEAVVDEQGAVKDVKVLRSIPLLDNAAIAAVEQWHYSPVMLNGRPVPFVLTVVVSFSIPPNLKTRY